MGLFDSLFGNDTRDKRIAALETQVQSLAAAVKLTADGGTVLGKVLIELDTRVTAIENTDGRPKT